MKVLLINPPFCLNFQDYISIPLGLGYLGSFIEKNGHSVKIFDSSAGRVEKRNNGFWHGKSYAEIKEVIKQEQPVLVGIGCFFSPRFPYTVEVAKLVKEINPKIFTVVGGIHATILPREVLRNNEIDFVIIGEGEYSFLQLIEKLERKESDFGTIDGIAFRNNGDIVVFPKTKFIENLDDLPFPALHLLPVEEYFKYKRMKWWSSQGRCFPIVSSRSCPYRCHFCSMYKVHGQKWRARSAKNVVDEIEYLINVFRAEMISFQDDNLTLSKTRMIEICEEIKRRSIKIKWNTPNGISIKTLDKEVLAAMQDSGCIEVNLAIESGDEIIRNQKMHKKLSLNKIIEVANACKKLRLKANAYFIVGYPGDNDETINKTIKLVKKLSFFNIAVSYATPFPGTELYDECVENNYIQNDFIEQAFNKGELRLFLQPCIKTKEFNYIDVIRWKKKIKFNFYKHQMLRLLKGDRNSWANLFRILQIIFKIRYHAPNP